MKLKLRSRSDVGSAEVISARAITGVNAVCYIKFSVIEAGRHSCTLVMLYHSSEKSTIFYKRCILKSLMSISCKHNF